MDKREKYVLIVIQRRDRKINMVVYWLSLSIINILNMKYFCNLSPGHQKELDQDTAPWL